jgi:hypothetical protein
VALSSDDHVRHSMPFTEGPPPHQLQGRVESQYLVGIASPFGHSITHHSSDISGVGAVVIAMRGLDTHGSKAGDEWGVGAFAPGDLTPGSLRQIPEIDFATRCFGLSGHGRKPFALPLLDHCRITLIRPLQRVLRRQSQLWPTVLPPPSISRSQSAIVPMDVRCFD